MIPSAARRQATVTQRFVDKTSLESLPAPHGGLNTRDSIEGMSPVDATVLDNWVPGVAKVTVRKGYSEYATGMGSGAVETLAEYNFHGTHKLIAAANGGLYDITNTGAVSAGTTFITARTNNRWDTAMFNGRLHFVNGADTPLDYDGTSVAAVTWTGPTPSNLNGVCVYKNRLYFWDTTKASFWYGGLNAQSGALTEFPLGRVVPDGGNIVQMISWTVDGGAGPEDYAVFIMSSGQVAVYAGSDPGDATDWAIKGIYNIGNPIGRTGSAGPGYAIKVGADVLIPTVEDYVSLTSMFKGGDLSQKSKLTGLMSAAYKSSSSGYGWGSVLNRRENLLIFNVPRTSTTFEQHVINTITGAPCRFRDIDAYCWSNYDTELYFGATGGIVYKYGGTAGTTYDDDGTAISTDGIQAWTDLGTKYRKRGATVRPIIEATGNTTYEVGVGWDYEVPAVASPSIITSVGTPWPSPWGSPWSSESEFSTEWRVTHGTGHVLATRLKVNTKVSVSWTRTDYRVETGRSL